MPLIYGLTKALSLTRYYAKSKENVLTEGGIKLVIKFD